MNLRKIPRADLFVSEIGFGTWGIGGDSFGSVAYGKTDDQVSKLALAEALKLGVSFFDTSDFYGYGHSEHLLSSVFKNQRDKVFYATKGGLLSTTEKDFSIKHIGKAISSSLSRLQTDYIDLYQLHNPNKLNTELDELIPFLQKKKKEGSIRLIGLSAENPNDAIYFIQRYPIDSIQINFNLIDQRPLESGLLELCEKNEIMVISRTPLCFGFLTDFEIDIDNLPMNDHRNLWPREQLALWKDARLKFSFLKEEFPDLSMVDIALNYCLSYPAITTVIPGILNSDEVKMNAKVSSIEKFSKEILEKIEKTYKENTFFLARKK